MKLRPCIDIHGGHVKQIVGGSIGQGTSVKENFVSEHGAAYYAALYREAGLKGGHIILLDSAASDPDAYRADRVQALSALSAFPGGMQIGGGINPQNAGSYLTAGASHVIVTSYVFKDGRLNEAALGEMIRCVGRNRLVLDLSCRKRENGRYYVVTDRWQKFTDLEISRETLLELSSSCDEFLIHAADVEGKRSGIEESLVVLLGDFQKETGFPVTYAGGVHSLQDLDLIWKLSGDRMDVTVGSALKLFGGDLELSELAKYCIGDK